MLHNVRSYTQVGNLTTEFTAKCCNSIYYFPFNNVPKPDLRIAVVVEQHFLHAQYFNFQFQGYFPTGDFFFRMKFRPVALSRNKEKLRVLHSSSNGRSLPRKAKAKKTFANYRFFIQSQTLQRTKKQRLMLPTTFAAIRRSGI